MMQNTIPTPMEAQAKLIIDTVHNSFGQGELLLHCLSSKTTGDRCKSAAAEKSLFCSMHCQMGATATALLRAVNQLDSSILAHYMAKGQSVKALTAFEAEVKSQQPMRLKSKVKTNRCVTKKGHTCTTPTKNADGYCHYHRDQAKKAKEEEEDQDCTSSDAEEEAEHVKVQLKKSKKK